MLADSYGRVATDLRVSLTDRCNLRCSYCMPPEGLDWLPGADQLTGDELIRLLRIAVGRLGITEIRFTGGEPILRRGLNRVRLTADGQVRNCLFAREESDLRTPLRAGACDDELADIWRRAVAAKLPGHGINDPGFLQPARPMSAIGG